MIVPICLALGVSLFYLSFHSTFYNFDGVACAIAVELGDWKHLAHGNHLAYGGLGRAFFLSWQALGYRGPALLPLQALDSMLGGAGVGLFCAALRRAGISSGLAVSAALALAVSQAYWIWSLEAQVYMLGTFCAIGALWQGLSTKPSGARLGLWHAGAVLGHAGHVALAPALIWLLWRGFAPGRARARALRDYALAAALLLAAAYGAAALWAVRPQSLEELRVWLLGSAALKVDKSFGWHGGWSLEHLTQWSLMSLRIFSDPIPLSGRARLASAALALAALATALWGLRAALGRRGSDAERTAAGAAGLWLGAYAPLYSSWEPYTVVYRVSDLPALWLAAALGVARLGRRRAAAAAGAWTLAAGLLNLKAAVLPACDPLDNSAYQETLWVAESTPEDAWVVAGGLDQVYAPYFGHRRPLAMRYFAGRPEALLLRLHSLEAKGEPVFVTDRTLAMGDWKGVIERYGAVKVAARGERTLYRVTRTGSRAGAGRKG